MLTKNHNLGSALSCIMPALCLLMLYLDTIGLLMAFNHSGLISFNPRVPFILPCSVQLQEFMLVYHLLVDGH